VKALLFNTPQKNEHGTVMSATKFQNPDITVVPESPWNSVLTWPAAIQPTIEYHCEDLATRKYEGFHDLRKSDLQCLFPRTYLNHSVVDRFINTRSNLAQEHYARVYAFTTEFMMNIHTSLPSGIKEAMRSNVLNKDIVLAPYARDDHWSLYVICFKEQVVLHIDSLSRPPHPDVVPFLQSFISMEFRRKHSTNYDWVSWSYHSLPNIPNQGNDFDCGVHVCVWAHIICSGIKVVASSEKSDQIRMWIMDEVIKQPPMRFTDPKKEKLDAPVIKRTRANVRWQSTVPKKNMNAFDYCSSLIRNLFKSKDGVCAMENKCIAVGEKELFC
jgi:hypothetical protein